MKNILEKVKQINPSWFTWLTCFSYCFVTLCGAAHEGVAHSAFG